jgi:TPR repeat protein
MLIVLVLTIVVTFLPLARAGALLDDLIARAKAGDAEAEFDLGDMYRYGLVALSDGSHVQQNSEQSVLWLRKAADKDYAPAEYELGEILYKDDTRFEYDDRESLKWLQKFFATQGHRQGHRSNAIRRCRIHDWHGILPVVRYVTWGHLIFAMWSIP